MNREALNISSQVYLKAGDFYRNGELALSANDSTDQIDWFKQNYKELGMAYPKFHKMDSLSKLAVLSAEILLDDEIKDANPGEVGVLLFNRHSSIDADSEHQKLISDQNNPMASPAVFVYTLPNIMLGEICIRHGLHGENLCLIADEFDAESAIVQCELMMGSGMNHVILGWVDTFHGRAKSWLTLVQNNGNAPNISQLSAPVLNELDNIPTWKHS